MTDRKAFLLRLDVDLFQEIARRAQNDLRSINREIEFLLRRAVSKSGDVFAPTRRDAGQPKAPAPVLKGVRQGDRRR
jgi:hypothetical protein